VAGPWFTVQRSGSGWQTMGQVWISNGQTDSKGTFQLRVTLAGGPNDEHRPEEVGHAD